MKRIFLLVVVLAALFCGACTSTSYKAAPTILKVNEHASAVETHVSVAEEARKATEAREKAAAVKVKAGQAAVKLVGQHIDAAIGDLKSKGYTSAAEHLIAAKVNNDVVAQYLQQTLDDLVASGESLVTVKQELVSAKAELKLVKGAAAELQVNLNKSIEQGAKDHVIAVRCDSFLGLGAIFYGVERLVKAGIVGMLIVGVLAIVVVVASYFVGGAAGPVLKLAAGWILGLFRKNTSSSK